MLAEKRTGNLAESFEIIELSDDETYNDTTSLLSEDMA